MFSKVFGAGCYNVVYSMLILAVSAFCLTSVDTATRLARYMFQEFFTAPGESRENMPGWKKVVTNPYVATAITVVAGVALGMTGYAKIWLCSALPTSCWPPWVCWLCAAGWARSAATTRCSTSPCSSC